MCLSGLNPSQDSQTPYMPEPEWDKDPKYASLPAEEKEAKRAAWRRDYRGIPLQRSLLAQSSEGSGPGSGLGGGGGPGPGGGFGMDGAGSALA